MLNFHSRQRYNQSDLKGPLEKAVCLLPSVDDLGKSAQLYWWFRLKLSAVLICEPGTSRIPEAE